MKTLLPQIVGLQQYKPQISLHKVWTSVTHATILWEPCVKTLFRKDDAAFVLTNDMWNIQMQGWSALYGSISS